MQAMIPQPGSAAAPLDVSALAHVLAHMEPDIWTPALPGERWADVVARREAARDMLDELLAEVGGEVAA